MDTRVNILLGVSGANLVTSAFNGMRSSVQQFAGTALGLGGIMAGVRNALNVGGALNDLSQRTGQSVRDLVVLQRAFENAGLGADSVGASISRLQRTIEEGGGQAESALLRLGIRLDELRKLTAEQQLAALTQGFQRIASASERTALAMQLFGRSGAEMLQLLGDGEALATAEAEAGRLGNQMERNARVFDSVGDSLAVVKGRVTELFVSTTEQLLPALESVASTFKSLNLAPVGTGLGGTLLPSLGLMASAKVVPALDSAMLDWATRQGNPIGQKFAGQFLAPLTGSLARVLPVGLAAGVASEVVIGLALGFSEYRQGQRDEAANNASIGEARRKTFGGFTSGSQVSGAIAAERAIITSLRDQIKEENASWLTDGAKVNYLETALKLAESRLRFLRANGETVVQQNKDAMAVARDRVNAEAKLAELGAERLRAEKELASSGTLAARARFVDILTDEVRLGERVTAARWDEVRAIQKKSVETRSDIEKERLKEFLALFEKLADARQKLRETVGERAAVFTMGRATGPGDVTDPNAGAESDVAFGGDMKSFGNANAFDRARNAAVQRNDPNQADRISPIQGLMTGALDWANQLGTVGQQAAEVMSSSIGAAVSGIGQGIWGLITKTRSFGDAWRQIGTSVFQTVINAMVQMGVQMALNFALGKIFRKQEDADTKKSTTLKAAEGGMKSISQLGPIWGTLAFVAALAAIMAITGGFAGGGYTGAGGKYDPAGVVHRGEYVFSQDAVSRIGLSNLHALHSGRGSGYAAGGPVAMPSMSAMAGAAGAGNRPLQIVVVNEERDARRIERTSEVETVIVDTVRRKKWQL